MPTLSAVIATRDRPDLLADCLATLVRQEVAPERLEIIVLDDGSQPPLEGRVTPYTTAPIRVRYERQEPAGLQAARNNALALAGGEIVAFLDDDTLVSPHWAAAVIDAFERFGCDGLAGRIQLQLEGPEPRWLGTRLRAYLSELDFGPDAHLLERGEPYGANCAVTASAARAIGGFRSGLGRKGTSLISNEEIEFFRRLRAAGRTIAYSPEASVLHRVPPSRLTVDWFLRRAYAQGESDVLLEGPRDRIDEWGQRLAETLRIGWALPILARNIVAGRGAVGARVWVALCRGRLAALRRQRHAASTPAGPDG